MCFETNCKGSCSSTSIKDTLSHPPRAKPVIVELWCHQNHHSQQETGLKRTESKTVCLVHHQISWTVSSFSLRSLALWRLWGLLWHRGGGIPFRFVCVILILPSIDCFLLLTLTSCRKKWLKHPSPPPPLQLLSLPRNPPAKAHNGLRKGFV